MSQFGEGRVGRNKKRFIGRAAAALLLARRSARRASPTLLRMAEAGGFTAGDFMAGPSVAEDLAGFMVAPSTMGSITGSATGASTAAAFEGSAEGFWAGWDGSTIHIRMNGHIPIDGIIIRATATIPDNTVLRRTGIIAPTRQVITRT